MTEFRFDSIEDALDPQKNVEYAAQYLTKLYNNNDKDWLKAAMAYHSTTPRKALRYKKKIVSAYEMVKMAHQEREDRLFGERVEAQKTALNESRKNTKAVRTAAAEARKDRREMARIDANAWREAKLAEYRRNKVIASN